MGMVAAIAVLVVTVLLAMGMGIIMTMIRRDAAVMVVVVSVWQGQHTQAMAEYQLTTLEPGHAEQHRRDHQSDSDV